MNSSDQHRRQIAHRLHDLLVQLREDLARTMQEVQPQLEAQVAALRSLELREQTPPPPVGPRTRDSSPGL